MVASAWRPGTVSASDTAAPCDEALAAARAGAIRAHLDGEARRARRWDIGWAVGFGVITAGQLGLVAAEWTPLGDYDEVAEASLTVGAVKSGIGTLAHVILPLRITRAPAPTGDACADLDAAERALAATAAAERKAFWLNHGGSLALAVGGMLYLGLAEDDWGEGVTSFAIGYPVALLAVYLQPRGSWKAARDGRFERVGDGAAARPWFVDVVQAPGYTGVRFTTSW
jgi:hypothetical protein